MTLESVTWHAEVGMRLDTVIKWGLHGIIRIEVNVRAVDVDVLSIVADDADIVRRTSNFDPITEFRLCPSCWTKATMYSHVHQLRLM